MIFFCNYQLRNTFTENGVWELDYIDFDSTYYRYKANILNTSYFNKLNNLDHVYSYNEKNELISDINFEMLSGIKIPYSKMNKYISYRTNTLIDENYATIGILIFELITISIGIYISYRKDYN
jgi:hypothetical protein